MNSQAKEAIERLRTFLDSSGEHTFDLPEYDDLSLLASTIADLTEKVKVRDEAMRILAEKYIGVYYPKSNPFYESKVERLINDALDAAEKAVKGEEG